MWRNSKGKSQLPKNSGYRYTPPEPEAPESKLPKCPGYLYKSPPLCIIQWETAAFYSYESEKDGAPVPLGEEKPGLTDVSVGMTRLGSSEKPAQIQWRTFDISAKAGVNYVAVPPTWVKFEPGEIHKDLVVQVVPKDSFDGMLEFGLFIVEESADGAIVDEYLSTATVKIIDQSVFPGESLRAWVEGGKKEMVMSVSPAKLVWEFLKLCYSIDPIGKATLKVAFGNQYTNLVAILNIFIILLVTRTLVQDDVAKGNKEGFLLLLAALWVVPFVGCHYISYLRTGWGIEGTLTTHLNVLIVKKFMNFTEEGRNQVPVEKIVMTTIRDVTAAVTSAYLLSLDLVSGSLCKIVLLTGAVAFLQSETSGSSITSKVAPLLSVAMLSVVIFLFVRVRLARAFHLRQAFFDAQNASMSQVIKNVLNYQLVADYDRRTKQLETFTAEQRALNHTRTAVRQDHVNNHFFTPWVTTVLVAVWILVGGIQVLNGDLEVGTFLSIIEVDRMIGHEFEIAYDRLLILANAYSSIAQLTCFLNLPIDVPERLQGSRRREDMGKQIRAEARAWRASAASGATALPDDELTVDTLPIIMKNIDFKYAPPPKKEEVSLFATALKPLRPSDAPTNNLRLSREPPSRSGSGQTSSSLSASSSPSSSSAVSKWLQPKPKASQPLGGGAAGGAAAEAAPTVVSRSKLEHSLSFAVALGTEELEDKEELATVGEEEDEEQGNEETKRLQEPRMLDSSGRGGGGGGGAVSRAVAASFNLHGSLDDGSGEGGSSSSSDGHDDGSTGGIRGLNVTLSQGKMIALLGAPYQGKATVLRLLASQVFPRQSMSGDQAVFVPPHLRVIQIQENPLILGPEESIFENVTFGIQATPWTDWEEVEERALAIMRRLGLKESMLRNHFKTRGFLGNFGARVTRADRQLISIGRALVMNPEFIVAHKPTALLNDDQTDNVLELFREFIDHRGVLMDPNEPLKMRRKRTIIFSARGEDVAIKADEIYMVEKGAFKRVSHEALLHEMKKDLHDEVASTGARTEEALISAAWVKLMGFINKHPHNLGRITSLFVVDHKAKQPLDSLGLPTAGKVEEKQAEGEEGVELDLKLLHDSLSAILGIPITYAECAAWFRSFDKNRNGKMSLDEFNEAIVIYRSAKRKNKAKGSSWSSLSLKGTEDPSKSAAAAFSSLHTQAQDSGKSATAALTSLGSTAEDSSKSVTSALSSMGSAAGDSSKPVTAALSSFGHQTEETSKPVTSALSSLGVQSGESSKPVSAALSSLGEQAQGSSKSLTSALASVGAKAAAPPPPARSKSPPRRRTSKASSAKEAPAPSQPRSPWGGNDRFRSLGAGVKNPSALVDISAPSFAQGILPASRGNTSSFASSSGDSMELKGVAGRPGNDERPDFDDELDLDI